MSNKETLSKYFQQYGVQEVSADEDWETSSEQSVQEEPAYEEEVCEKSRKRRTLEKDRSHGQSNNNQ